MLRIRHATTQPIRLLKSLRPRRSQNFRWEVLVDEINARPAAQKASTLKDRHKFKTEMDQEALHAMFPHLKEKVA